MESDDSAYRVEPQAEGYSVVAPSGRTIMDCRDEHSANHYAVLLTEAYRLGYRAGFREGKTAIHIKS